MSDAARLDAIEAQLGTITPGLWEVDRNHPFTDYLVGIFSPGAKKYVVQVENQEDVDDPTSDSDAVFIASAPDTIRELLTLARKQAAALERVEALAERWAGLDNSSVARSNRLRTLLAALGDGDE